MIRTYWTQANLVSEKHAKSCGCCNYWTMYLFTSEYAQKYPSLRTVTSRINEKRTDTRGQTTHECVESGRSDFNLSKRNFSAILAGFSIMREIVSSFNGDCGILHPFDKRIRFTRFMFFYARIN